MSDTWYQGLQQLERRGLIERLSTIEVSVAAGAIDRELRPMRQRAKMINFGSPSVPSLECAELIYLWALLLVEQTARKHYREERELPEYVDMGGES